MVHVGRREVKALMVSSKNLAGSIEHAAYSVQDGHGKQRLKRISDRFGTAQNPTSS